MAVTASGLFYPTFAAALNNTLALDLNLETHKVALFDNTITPNFDTDTVYGAGSYGTTPEVDGTGWAAGGVALVTTAISNSPTGTLMWDAENVSETSTDLTDARCALIYADAATDEAIVLVDFTSDYSTVAGTFAITWDVLGIFTIDLTP